MSGRCIARTTLSGSGVGPGIRSWVVKDMGVLLAKFRRVRQEGDRARAFERRGERALMPRASAGYTPRQDLSAVADEPAQPRNLFVVDVVDLLDAKAADLPVLPLGRPR